MINLRRATVLGAVALFLLAAGCAKKKTALNTPPPPPPPEAVQSRPAAAQPPQRQAIVAPKSEQAPLSRYPNAATRARIEELLARIQDAYFDYDKHNLRPDAEKSLLADVQTLNDILKLYPDYKLTVEGHCDERGSAEYNLALGDARAKTAKDYLTTLGISGNQLETVSYGKERPQCTDHNEDCWQKNRRAHVVAMAR